MAEKLMTDGSMALREKQYRVITIEATEKPQNAKLRVAAYARVSSASDDQLNSFAAQNRHYSDLISSKENWRMVDIYADEGITGTSAEKREDFQRLLADCRRGLIDRVLVKSISRFARNTKECLETIRELKSLGVGVYFEKENIDTATMSGEMMTALFASFAQAESEIHLWQYEVGHSKTNAGRNIYTRKLAIRIYSTGSFHTHCGGTSCYRTTDIQRVSFRQKYRADSI
ncbi:MAG: recombinase family protein [Dysosmobacter sp.]